MRSDCSADTRARSDAQCCRRLLAIIGPSGSGKTTLLTALAGQMASSGALALSGEVTLNGTPQAQADVRQGFVAQEDIFYSQLTVRCAPRRFRLIPPCRPSADAAGCRELPTVCGHRVPILALLFSTCRLQMFLRLDGDQGRGHQFLVAERRAAFPVKAACQHIAQNRVIVVQGDTPDGSAAAAPQGHGRL